MFRLEYQVYKLTLYLKVSIYINNNLLLVKKLRMKHKKDKLEQLQRTNHHSKHHVKRHNRNKFYLSNLV